MDPLEELLLRAHPNPDRVGCPGSEIIREMGAKRLAHDDPRWEHLQKCSPCFGEFRELRDARLTEESASKRKRAFVWGGVAAALLLVFGVLASRILSEKNLPPPQLGTEYEAAVFNFEGTSFQRGSGPGTAAVVPVVQRLPRRNVQLTVYLARGSEDGRYELQILDLDNHAVISVQANAIVERGLTQFSSAVDLSKIPAGEYIVRSRRLPNGTWRLSKAIVESEAPKK